MSYGGATNEQYIDNLLKQTYSTLKIILMKIFGCYESVCRR